ncbi:methyl-accepting chemotaxis protein [Thaumasiovibrio subtropicus]|uniref:methyl-accepting chemotaxis protein n=1 Tax=Thaumasiovibrio subtropicus TaxID=1891207 RepID=UPI000B36104C|nr:methyl-accepting chemotaxis protein [Thaumasiovibrio subtropicus]
MKLKTKVWLIIGLTLAALVAVSIVGLLTMRHASNSDNEARIYQLLKSTFNTVVQIEKAVAAGELEEEQGKQLAIRILRENKYKDNEYVYVADSEMMFLATPHDPQLHGTSFHDFKDGDGKSVGSILQNAVRGQAAGKIVSYDWTSRGDDGAIHYLKSVAVVSDRWGWVVGTGIRNTEVNERFWGSARWQVSFSLLLAAIIGTLLFQASNRLLTILGKDPDEVLSLVHSVADGDLTSETDNKVDGKSIYGSVVKMQSSLRDIISNVATATDQLEEETQQAQQRAVSVSQISDEQHAETDMVATSMTEMSLSAKTVAESANNAAQATQDADKEGQNARAVVGKSSEAIEMLAGQIDEAANVIAELGHNVTEIVTVLDVIRGIAEQTNLLALNAAIEAARAGEQGRGFAVVADEVRNLAKRTQDSTEEIQVMIEKLEQGSERAISAMTQSKTSSEESVTMSMQASDALQVIASALGTITEMNHQIASAAQEQTQVGEDISERINLIAQNSSRASALAVDNQASTAHIGELADMLETQVKQFSI